MVIFCTNAADIGHSASASAAANDTQFGMQLKKLAEKLKCAHLSYETNKYSNRLTVVAEHREITAHRFEFVYVCIAMLTRLMHN